MRMIRHRIPNRPDLPAERVIPKIEALRWVKDYEVTDEGIVVTVPRGVAPTASEFRGRLARDAGLYI